MAVVDSFGTFWVVLGQFKYLFESFLVSLSHLTRFGLFSIIFAFLFGRSGSFWLVLAPFASFRFRTV